MRRTVVLNPVILKPFYIIPSYLILSSPQLLLHSANMVFKVSVLILFSFLFTASAVRPAPPLEGNTNLAHSDFNMLIFFTCFCIKMQS